MALEKRWGLVPPQAFTSNGTSLGRFSVANPQFFYVKQLVILSSGTQPGLEVQIKRIEGSNIFVGSRSEDLAHRLNISTYLVADAASVLAFEQPRPGIKPDDVMRAVYEEEPKVALRSMLVGTDGQPVNAANPLPVSATVNSVQLFTRPYDAITATKPSATVEVYTTRVGGISGAIQEVVTVTYEDASKEFVTTVERV